MPNSGTQINREPWLMNPGFPIYLGSWFEQWDGGGVFRGRGLDKFLEYSHSGAFFYTVFPSKPESVHPFWPVEHSPLLSSSCLVMLDSLQPHGLQHSNSPVLHYLPEFAQIYAPCISDAI